MVRYHTSIDGDKTYKVCIPYTKIKECIDCFRIEFDTTEFQMLTTQKNNGMIYKYSLYTGFEMCNIEHECVIYNTIYCKRSNVIRIKPSIPELVKYSQLTGFDYTKFGCILYVIYGVTASYSSECIPVPLHRFLPTTSALGGYIVGRASIYIETIDDCSKYYMSLSYMADEHKSYYTNNTIKVKKTPRVYTKKYTDVVIHTSVQN